MKRNSETCCFELPIETVDGTFTALYSLTGLAGIRFPLPNQRRQKFTTSVPREVDAWHRATTRAITRILAGKDPEAWPPLDLSDGTDFQREVWLALRQIKAGHTRSYGEI